MKTTRHQKSTQSKGTGYYDITIKYVCGTMRVCVSGVLNYAGCSVM